MNSFKVANEGVVIVERTFSDGTFTLSAKYKRNLIDEDIVLEYTSAIGQPLSKSVSMEAFLPLVLYDEEHCQVEASTKRFLFGAQVMAYVILVSSIVFPFLSCKIVGLELFGLLQLSYFALSSQKYLNSYL